MKICTAIVLTYNEEIHIERCITRLKSCEDMEVIVVDSYSTDRTSSICESLNIPVYQNEWVNYSTQFTYALEKLEIHTPWVLRIDADEYLDERLLLNLSDILLNLPKNINGLSLILKRKFLGHAIRFGIYRIRQLRIFRNNCASIQMKEMDEHIVLRSGGVKKLNYFICDDNINDIDYFLAKHMSYAKREASDIIRSEYSNNILFKTGTRMSQMGLYLRLGVKRIYLNFPLFVRPVIYFFIRYFILLGFLDGKIGFLWHFLQGLWYRTLVDYYVLKSRKK